MARYGPTPRPVEDRFWDHVTPGPVNECWEWQGATDSGGYGYLTLTRTPRVWVKAHRLSWEIHNGPIPEGKVICHQCDNPPCQNPRHLFTGTRKDNNADRHAKGRSRGGTTGNRRDHTGAANPNAKLSEDNVRVIIAVLRLGVPQARAARMFDVSPGAVGRIARRESWAHLWDE